MAHKQEMQLFRPLRKNRRSKKKPEEGLSHLNAFIPYIRGKTDRKKHCSVVRGAATKGAQETLPSISLMTVIEQQPQVSVCL